VAKELVVGFKGWGPNLYMKEWKQWNAWLGQDGQAIFALLMEVHGREGAVPSNVEIAHVEYTSFKPPANPRSRFQNYAFAVSSVLENSKKIQSSSVCNH
jgi:hypothetical protein